MFHLFSNNRNLILSVHKSVYLEFSNNKCTVEDDTLLEKIKATAAFKNGDIFLLEDKDAVSFERTKKSKRPRTVQGVRTTKNTSDEEDVLQEEE